MDGNSLKNFKICGTPWHIAVISSIIILLTAYTGALSKEYISIMGLIMAYGVIFYEIGERLPIWNSYIGGGVLMCFFGTAIIMQFHLVPGAYVGDIHEFISGKFINFLTTFNVILIVGSVLSLDRKVLLKSFVGYIPTIMGALIVSMVFGIAGGMIFGISPADILIKYVLPIMGGGNGAGAVPLSQIYERITGDPAINYYGFAIIILTVANILSIISAGLLNKLGDVKPNLTGNKKTLLRGADKLAKETEDKYTPTIKDIGAALFLTCTCYALAQIFAKFILPTVFGAPIHEFAYLIIFVTILSAFGVIPSYIRAGAKWLQNFMASACSLILMAGLGFEFNLVALAESCTISNVFIALSIVIGAVVGAGVVGYMVGLYPIDSAITAGLCMANRGGNGDIAVLGASRRMSLIAYAQLSTRLGGGIVLVLGSFIFSFFLR